MARAKYISGFFVGVRVGGERDLIGDHSPVHDLLVAVREVLQDHLTDG